MTTVRAKHPPYENGHLGEVVSDMRVAGAPTIRVVRFRGEKAKSSENGLENAAVRQCTASEIGV